MFISIVSLVITLAVYFINKQIYKKWHFFIFMPLLFTPVILILLISVTHLPWPEYIGETHWLLWLLGPATLAFAVPIYENMPLIKKHWLSISSGVLTAVFIAAYSSVWLSRLLHLPDIVQRSMAVRSVTTPFALAAVSSFQGQPDLAAFFVAMTGVLGMMIGDFLFVRLSILQGVAKGAGLGAASHGVGTAKSYELGETEGVISSLVMMLSGVAMVILAPLLNHLLFY